MQTQTTIFEPDAFPNDWYGWCTNQISHIFVGLFAVFVLCILAFFVIGEMPHKAAVYSVVLCGYVAFEVIAQGWRGLDTIEDTVFVTAYGAGGILAGFTEVEAGSTVLAVNIFGLLPFFTVAVLHLIFGSLARWLGRV